MLGKNRLIPFAAALAAASALAVPSANADTFTTPASLVGDCTPTGSSCKVLVPGSLVLNIVTPSAFRPGRQKPGRGFVITVFVVPGSGPAVASQCEIPTDEGPNPLATCTTLF